MTTKIKSGVIAAGAIDATALADNSITIGHLDCSDGTAGQFLKTDGSGTLSFDSVPAGYTDSDVETYLNTSEIYTDATNNRLGIGASIPADKLHVAGDFLLENGAPEIHLGTTSASHYNWKIAAQDAVNKGFEISSGTQSAGTGAPSDTYTQRVVIAADTGNVGIGTDSPDMQLEVAGSSGSSSTFKLSGRPDWASGNGQYNVGNIYGENLGAGVNTTRIKLDGDDTSGSMRFYTANSGTLTSAMYIDSNQDITMSSTGFLKIPIGTTAQRPSSPAGGMIRYNTTENYVEYYNGSSWNATDKTLVTASGGTTATYSGYKSHTFTSSGTFSVTSGGLVDILIVAGGGSGGRDNAGGGGAGGVRVSTSVYVTSGTTYTITVGAGGASDTNDYAGNGGSGFNGNDSSALGITSIGGGFGGSAGTDSNQNRTSGGSGGGGAGTESLQTGAAGTAGQGNAGGSGSFGGGGGGGAGAAGGNGANPLGGLGGIGIQNNYRTGSNVYYGGGGGAGNENGTYTTRAGGSGGGGTGGVGGGTGTANTGGGGGGHTHSQAVTSSAGGSGIVVIRYIT
jgi:hypothetical protein